MKVYAIEILDYDGDIFTIKLFSSREKAEKYYSNENNWEELINMFIKEMEVE